MDENPFVIFKMFAYKVPAQSLADILESHHIEHLLEDNSASLSDSFGGGELAKEFAVSVRESDVKRVNELLENEAENELDSVDKDYYLFGFSDDELRDVVMKSDEWNAFDVVLAKKLLSGRGVGLSENDLQKFQQERLETLAQPEKPQPLTVFVGYLFAIISGFLGIAIGWFLYSQKKTLPNGEKVYSFTQSDRRHGRNMMILGGGILAAVFLYEMLDQFFSHYQC